MRRLPLIAALGLATGAIALAGPAAAAFDPDLAAICSPDAANSGGAHIDRMRLVRAVLDDAQITDLQISMDGAELTNAQRRDFLVDPNVFCVAPRACAQKAVDAALNAKVRLRQFLSQHLRSGPSADDVYIVWNGPAADGSKDLVGGFLVDPGEKFSSVCRADKIKAPDIYAGKPEGGSDEQAVSGPEPRLRGSVDDLQVASGADGFDKVSRANIAITDDFLVHNSSLTVEGAFGVAVDQSDLGHDVAGEFLPYIYYKRQHVSGPNPSNTADINNLAFGLMADLDKSSGLEQDLSSSVQVLKDLDAKTELLTLSETWSPRVDYPGWGTAIRSPDGSVWFWWKPSAKLVLGHVLDRGTSMDFKAANNYGRGGPQVEGWLIVTKGPLDGLGASASFVHLESFYGKLPSVQNVTASLSYTMPKAKNLALELKYVDGRDPDTLEKQHQLTVGLGLKY